MNLPEFLLRNLRLASWPQPLRKPLVLGLIKRKSLTSLPFTTRYHRMQEFARLNSPDTFPRTLVRHWLETERFVAREDKAKG